MESYVISVSVGTGCYRHIQINANATLYKLHQAIINAFDFEDDHEHAFFMDNHIWMPDQMYVSTKREPRDRPTKKYTLKKLGLKKGMAFKYVFDFGDEWRFQCKVLRELDEKTDIPCIIRSVGESPEQYPDCDEYDYLPPEELEKIYQMLPLSRDTIQNIQNYLNAAANMYGLIPVKEVYKIYNSQNSLVAEDDFYEAAAAILCGETGFVVANMKADADTATEMFCGAEIAAEYLCIEGFEENLEGLRSLQRGKSYKILPKDEFLKYAHFPYYPETPQRKAMIAYLQKRRTALTMSPEDFCDHIQSAIMTNADLELVLEHCAESGLVFHGIEDINAFMAVYSDLSNHTYMHANRGYTPKEMSASRGNDVKQFVMRPPMEVSRFVTDDAPLHNISFNRPPSRNAPCPCGSGRKYKNCCGKLPN